MRSEQCGVVLFKFRLSMCRKVIKVSALRCGTSLNCQLLFLFPLFISSDSSRCLFSFFFSWIVILPGWSIILQINSWHVQETFETVLQRHITSRSTRAWSYSYISTRWVSCHCFWWLLCQSSRSCSLVSLELTCPPASAMSWPQVLEGTWTRWALFDFHRTFYYYYKA